LINSFELKRGKIEKFNSEMNIALEDCGMEKLDRIYTFKCINIYKCLYTIMYKDKNG